MAGNEGGSPVTHFGRQVRKERLARGWSIHELSRRTEIAAGHLSRIENGKRPPTENVAVACDGVFPERRGWFLEYYEESKTWVRPDSGRGPSTRTRPRDRHVLGRRALPVLDPAQIASDDLGTPRKLVNRPPARQSLLADLPPEVRYRTACLFVTSHTIMLPRG